MLGPANDRLEEFMRLNNARSDLRFISSLRNRRETQAYRLRKLHGKLYRYAMDMLFCRYFGS